MLSGKLLPMLMVVVLLVGVIPAVSLHAEDTSSTVAVIPEPFLELPIFYDGYSFDRAVSGTLGPNNGLVNSWFDHTYPNYGSDGEITPWSGHTLSPSSLNNCVLGVTCYAGHNGIDFQHDSRFPQQFVISAAGGLVRDVCIAYPCSRGGGYGRYIEIDHQNGYMTLYAHLDSVADLPKGFPICGQCIIGIMGKTSTRKIGVHLHFGLYYDNSINPTWPESAAVDPFGWWGPGVDPATKHNPPYPASWYMWKHPMNGKYVSGLSDVVLHTPSNTFSAKLLAGSLSPGLTVNLFGSPVPKPSVTLNSLGYGFQLQVLEWLNGMKALATQGFNLPVDLSVSYTPEDMQHINENSLQIMQWNGSSWVGLPTVVDILNHVAIATTIEPGTFDLQGTLSCTSDAAEPDDIPIFGTPLVNTIVSKSFDNILDQDWFVIEVVSSGTYTFETSDLATGVDTVLTLHDDFGTQLSYSNDYNDNRASYISENLEPGRYFLQVAPYSGSTTGCDATYRLSMTVPVSTPFYVFLPLITK